MLVALPLLTAGCDVGGGELTGMGGGTLATGAGGAGTMTGSGGAGVSGGGTGSGGLTGSVCTTMFPAEPVPPDILIVLDTSASMNDSFGGPCPGGCGFDTKWNGVVSAITAAINDSSSSVNWGLQMMSPPGEDLCAAASVAVGVGPTSAAGIDSELTRRSILGQLSEPSNTPARAAMQNAFGYLSSLTTLGDHIVLLVTDGLPDCGKGAADVLASDAPATAQAITHANTLGVPTLVAGLAIAPEAEAALSDMALAGGFARDVSPAYFPVSNSPDLVSVMSALVAETACTYLIPAPPGDGVVSRSSVGVFIDGEPIPQNWDDGWQYRDPNLLTFQLTGAACDAARAGSAVSVIFRCLLP
jgi:hypothetical protein